VGRRLTTFLNEPFPVRASLAKQLLEMANKFYENPTNFINDFTDMSPDNFAVDEDTLTVRAVDLENFIVVDKEALIRSKSVQLRSMVNFQEYCPEFQYMLALGTSPENDKLLESESMPCDQGSKTETPCFSFSTEDLCVRPHTDHNHYAICAVSFNWESFTFN